jgi:hypothetical protein
MFIGKGFTMTSIKVFEEILETINTEVAPSNLLFTKVLRDGRFCEVFKPTILDIASLINRDPVLNVIQLLIRILKIDKKPVTSEMVKEMYIVDVEEILAKLKERKNFH